MRITTSAVVLVGLLALPLQAEQQLQLKFQLFEGDAKILDALESRLLAGGAPAIQAMEKMPDFVRSRAVKLLEELVLTTDSGQRAKGKSSDKMLKTDLPDWEIVDGLDIEIDPVFSEKTGTVDTNLALRWGRKEGGDVRYLSLTTTVVSRNGEPILLTRISTEKADRLTILTVTAPGTTPTGFPQTLLYLDTGIYESETEAQGGHDPVARMVFPTRSGQRARLQEVAPLIYETEKDGGEEVFDVGVTIEVDPTLSSDKASVDLSAAISHSEKGGTVRATNGVRIPKVTMRRTVEKTSLKPEEKKIAPLQKSVLGVNAAGESDDWRASLRVRLGLGGAELTP